MEVPGLVARVELLPDSIAIAGVISAKAGIHMRPFSDSVVARCIVWDAVPSDMFHDELERSIAHNQATWHKPWIRKNPSRLPCWGFE
tara:strand:- start:114 stop:374 length:261 start_codon:yes stop_codon:yes gene_type:complete